MIIPIKEEDTGSWSLVEDGTTFQCDHEYYHVEQVEHMSPNPDSSYVWYDAVYVCDDCDETLDLDVEPEQDMEDFDD